MICGPDLIRTRAADLFGPGARITGLRPSARSSTHPAYVATAATVSGPVEALCKCELGPAPNSFGHRGGIRYEMSVFRDLAGTVSSMPRFVAAWADSEAAVLAVEYLHGATPLKELLDGDRVIVELAALVGFMQRDVEPGPDIVRHGSDYYIGWARRAARFNRSAGGPRRFDDACRRAEALLDSLASFETTLLHGELTPGNVLVVASGIRIVDWESAATGPGEIDLIAITHLWPSSTQRCALDAYVASRWDGRPPDDLARRLDLARLYWDLRWLGDRAHWWEQARLRDRVPDVIDTVDRLLATEVGA